MPKITTHFSTYQIFLLPPFIEEEENQRPGYHRTKFTTIHNFSVNNKGFKTIAQMHAKHCFKMRQPVCKQSHVNSLRTQIQKFNAETIVEGMQWEFVEMEHSDLYMDLHASQLLPMHPDGRKQYLVHDT